MNIFARLLKKKASARRSLGPEVDTKLKPLRPFYPPRRLFIPEAMRGYPRVVSLVANGMGAYLLDVHVTADIISSVQRQIEKFGFLGRLQTGRFQTHLQDQEAISLQAEPLGGGFTLLLVSNSIELLEALPDLSPPAPWQAFPGVDASGLGSRQGSFDYWWRHYWWPYWQSLTRVQRNEWLHDAAHPEDWRSYVRLQDASADNDTESPA